jgi:hypothetical protein
MLTHRNPEWRGIGKSMKARRRYTRAVNRGLEILEPRHLLTADLTGIFLTAPASVFSATKQAVTVRVTNSGDIKASGSLAIAFYAAPDGTTFDPATALSVGRVTKSASILPGGTLDVNCTVTVSAALSAGTYRLYAVLDADNKIPESDETNNVVQSETFAVAQPDYNLVTAFDSHTSLRPSILDAQKTDATVRVVITNSSGGTATLPSGQKVAVQVVARPVDATDDSQDVVLNRSSTLANVGSLKPGHTRTLSIGIRFPATLADGSYDIIVKVDTANALAETNETDNQATLDQSVLVAPPFTDPKLTFNSATAIPADVVADGRSLPLKLDVTNLGNIKIPSGQTTSISIVAHNIFNYVDTALRTFTVSLSGLGAGKTKTLKLTPTVVTDLTAADYAIEATLDTTSPGDLTDNNSASSATAMTVGPAFYNLQVQTPTSTFSPAVTLGTAASGSVSVRVRNLSNTLIPAGTTANITVVLRPVGASSTDDDVTIGSIAQASLGNLALGASKTFRVSSTIPASLPADAYQIVVTVTPAALDESSIADNTALGDTLTVAAPFVDLAITSATEKFPTPAAAGTSAAGTVVLRNMGNTTIRSNVTILFFATASGSAIPFQIGSGTFPVTLSPGASTFPLATALTLNLPSYVALAQSVTVEARIAQGSLTSLGDTNPANDRRTAGTVVVSSQYVDLYISSVTNPFSGTLNGSSTASGYIQLGNFGSGLASGDVTVSFYASLTNTLDGSPILLGSQTLQIAIPGGQHSSSIAVPLTLPNPAELTTYKILAQISADLTVDNNPNNNLPSVLGTVTVNPIT